jgi:hypothetical protein
MQGVIRHRVGFGARIQVETARMINIENLTESELVELNKRIVDRLRHLQHTKTHQAMLKFRPGDRGSFRGHDGREVSGPLLKYNKKTVTVITNSGARWNVSLGLLGKDVLEPAYTHTSTVIPLKQE